MKVGFVSLGCSKNLIDTEMAIGLFKRNNFEIVNDVEKAEIIIVNTCGFIESAKQEAINTILEMAEYKEKGTCKYLVVMGCLVQRYKKELQKALPEVDLFIEINDYGSYWDKILELLDEEEKPDTINNLCYMDRVISTGNKTAYLKIAEGCSNRCTYCAIPYIRGPYVSRPMEEVLEEAKKLATAGIKELIVIAQDTTRYGEDLYGESKLSDLLNELCKIDGFEWIRFLYAYPESITDELIQTVKNNPKICNYFDIPIQHISDSVLRRMNRRTTGKQIEELINKIKKQIPDVILRTSLIVGFPGETEEDFNKLYEFVKKGYFDKLGVFTYSKEDGTPAARLKEQIHPATKKKRYNLIMSVAKDISAEKLKSYIGKEYNVLVEDTTFDHKFCVGRSYMDIPDTDGMVIIKDCDAKLVGEFVNCKVTAVNNYDLIAKISNK
ncbi:MAG: 30S ribosomal protein S12 methylthiotransferase RimO [Clostridia bacterium]|jgi:ribosomal protein S12 methylthiotransferase|nr:30S ribosomal protein S12 methylthiotransferase RimO [Clostridia bacterium]